MTLSREQLLASTPDGLRRLAHWLSVELPVGTPTRAWRIEAVGRIGARIRLFARFRG